MAEPKNWLDDDDNFSFTLMNPEMLDELVRTGTVKLPKKKIQIPKDMRWNLKMFNSELIQGLLKGESMESIANRLFPEIMRKAGNPTNDGLIKKCLQSAIRNARTMVTGAENEGRLDSYKALADEGVVQKKQWEATADDRTRPSHLDMDGEEQDINAVFSNGCRYPGDGQGPAEEVWQCRCTMTDRIVGFRRKDGSISYVKGSQGRGIHEDAIDDERKRRR